MRLSGIVHRGNDEGHVRRLLAVLGGDYSATESSICSEQSSAFAVAVQVPQFMAGGAQVFKSSDGRFTGAAIGELYADAESPRSLDLLFDHFISHGFEGWENLNGQHLLVVYDSLAGKLQLINDRFGFQPVYYWHCNGQFLFASRIADLIRLMPTRPRLSAAGVSQIMLYGHHFGSGTLFEDIQCLPAASMLTFDGSTPTVARYWRIRYRSDSSITKIELADSLSTAVRRQCVGEGRKGILLSGGLDSRVVAHEAVQSTDDLHAFTFGLPGSMDVVFAATIAKRLAIAHEHLIFDPAEWARCLPKAARLSDGEADIQHFRSIQFHDTMAGSCEVMLTGLSGDLVMGSMIKRHHLGKMGFDAELQYALQFSLEHPIPFISRLFQEDRATKLIELAEEAVRETLSDNENDLSADRLTSWNIENRQRRFIFMGPYTDRGRFHVRTPFYDYDCFDCALRIPASRRLGEAFYIDTLWQMMPTLRNIPWQKTGIPPRPRGKPQELRELAAKVRKRLGIGRRGSFVDLGSLVREAFSEDALLDMLVRHERAWHDYIRPTVVAELLHEHFAGIKNHSTLITKLLTLTYTEESVF